MVMSGRTLEQMPLRGKTCLTPQRLNFFTVIYNNSVCTSHEAHYVTATKPNRLMLFGETVSVYCANHTEHQIHSVGRMQSFSMLKRVVHIVTTGL
jgi:hypothetical protein